MKQINLKIALAVVGFAATSAHALTLTITWLDGENNGTQFSVGPGLTTASTINSTAFSTTPQFPPPNPRNSEFRMVDPGGYIGGGGEKSILNESGDQVWVFENNQLVATGTDFPLNPGAFAGAAPVPGTNPTLHQNAPFLGPAFNALAPTTTSLAGIAYGPATINIGTGDNFSIHFPALEYQWGGTYFPLGSNSGGVTFQCTGAVTQNIHCAAEHTFNIANGDDPGAAGFSGWTAQWNLYGTFDAGAPRIVVGIDNAGNNTQECASQDGTVFSLTANTTVTNGAVLESLVWEIDGDFFSTATHIEPQLALGTHNVTVTATAENGASDTNDATLEVEDRTRPELVAAFKDASSGEIINSVMNQNTQFVEVSIKASDVCDPQPQVTQATITPAYMTMDGEVLKIKPGKGSVELPVSSLRLNAAAIDASGNRSNSSTTLEIIK